MANIIAAANEFGLDLTKERMADMRAAYKREGKRVAGRVPIGYQTDPATKQLDVNEEQARRVHDFFELAAGGSRPSDLAGLANLRSWPDQRGEIGKWTAKGGFPKLAMGGKDQGGRQKPPIIEMITKWAKALECSETPTLDTNENGVRTLRFGPGANESKVVYFCVEGLGHHWAGGTSQAPAFLVGKNSNKLNATDVVWDFFKSISRPR